MIAARHSRSPARRRPPPCGRMTSVGGTTRRNSTHNSSGTNRSTRSVMHGSTSDHAIRNDVLAALQAPERGQWLTHTPSIGPTAPSDGHPRRSDRRSGSVPAAVRGETAAVLPFQPALARSRSGAAACAGSVRDNRQDGRGRGDLHPRPAGDGRMAGPDPRNSQLPARPERSQRLAELAAVTEARSYLCGTGGMRYLQPEPFTRKNITVTPFRPLFEVSKSAANRIIGHLGPALALQPRQRFRKDAVLIVDGTLAPTRDHAVADQVRNASRGCTPRRARLWTQLLVPSSVADRRSSASRWTTSASARGRCPWASGRHGVVRRRRPRGCDRSGGGRSARRRVRRACPGRPQARTAGARAGL
ncbi:hypothetical protein SAMN06272775_0132 [Streptomyces sp. 2323.1]|nr:hypothetical protein SAMN06272775_0132 [Streptomyces sp. 2323.1]